MLNERCEVNSKDGDVFKTCASFLKGNFPFSEACSWRRSEGSWRRSEDEIENVATLVVGGKIFSTKWVLRNLLLGLKYEQECELDASADAITANAPNEALVLFSF